MVFKLAVLQITHDRILDAKIGMDLIKKVWIKEKALQNVDIYHAYNGKTAHYPEPYLEDDLIRRRNLGHLKGATDLMNAGIKSILYSGKQYDYILVMSADVWLVKPKKLVDVLKTMRQNKYSFADTLWPSLWFVPTYFASEFFIITPELAMKVFPLDIPKFLKNGPLTLWMDKIAQPLPLLTVPKVELILTDKVLSALNHNFWTFAWLKDVYLLPGRKMYTGPNRHYSSELGYLSHHNLDEKRRLARDEFKITSLKSL